MKILCVSDQVDPLVYSTSVKERFGDVDLVLSAGDLPMEYLGFIVSCLNKPLLFVFGNHNLSELDRFSRKPALHARRDAERGPAACHEETTWGSTYIGFKAARESGVLLAGLGGSMRYNNGPNQFSDLQMLFKILGLLPALAFNRVFRGRWLDILLTHAPPEGIHDKDDPCHRGFRCYRWFMDTFKPKLLVHGHIHLYDMNDARVTVSGGTTVVNAFGHHIVTFGEVPGE